jgi:hypothetical protein
MSWFKDLTRSHAVHEATNALLAAYCRFVHITGRWENRHVELHDQASAMAEGRVIYAIWHSRLQMIWSFPKIESRRTHALASGHRDGRLIARMMERFGFRTITGSTSKRGAIAFREMLRVVKRGDKIILTPDGPRGPSRVAQMGAVALARATGVPILPFGFSATRTRTLDSWDRMQVMLPFGRGIYVVGTPIVVPKDAEDLEPYRFALESALNRATDEADAATGYVLPPRGETKRRKKAKS